jgi:Uri superfamily endonuclease
MFKLQDLPAAHGTYALHLLILRAQPISIGCLGQYQLPAGDYFYLGSARGAGGLQARVGRHLRGDGKRHWHIDYLRASAEVRDVLYTVTDTPLECMWSQALAQLHAAVAPVPHFGSSDCRSGCAAHLIGFPLPVDIADVLQVLGQLVRTPITSLRNS